AGSYPGIILARVAPILGLKGKLTQKDAGGQLTRKALVTTQFAISIVLLIATIVIGKQLDYAVNTDLGFDKEAIVMMTLPEELDQLAVDGLKERMSEVPGVTNISACLSSPGAAENTWGTGIQYHNRPEREEFSIQAKMADQDYIKTFGLELVIGRNFKTTDSIQEVVVNEILAQKLGLDSVDELLGKRLILSGGGIQAEVVGVVANFHDQNFHEAIRPVFIAPRVDAYSELAVKMQGSNIKTTLAGIADQWKQTFPDYIHEFHFMDERVAEQYESEQRLLSLSKLFSIIAISICCLGLYGMLTFFVSQKTKEIGIRKVLGGSVLHILNLFTSGFLKLLGIAALIACPIAWYFMRNWLEGYQFKTELNWWIFALSLAAIMLITMLTITYKIYKAARANPIKSIRTE
ncbi:MAG: FtsX-like permease family protein, partial [Bacteroidota bacterium]